MAESGIASLSRQQLVDYVATFVRDRFADSGRGVSGAVIADAVRQKYPDADLRSEIGDRWLATVATEAEHSGKVLRNHSVKHLELSPPGHQSAFASPLDATSSSRFYVQDDIWKAFVFLPQTRPAFFDRTRNRVVALCEHDQSNRYVEIKAISADVQKEWFRQFVASNDGLAESDPPVNDEHWWRTCPEWLRDQNPAFEYRWRGFRADRVTKHIRQWAKTAGVDPAAILSPAQRNRGNANDQSSHRSQNRSGDRTREAILAAIRDMPIDELENLCIPVRYILRHFDAR